MKQYKTGDKITLEVKPSTLGCTGCFFNDCNAEGCDVFCAGVEGNTIWTQIVEDTSAKHIDWEQRRYEIAKELYCRHFNSTPEDVVRWADALIEELKKIRK